MEETEKITLEVYPLFATVKNLESLIEKGIFCKKTGDDKIMKILQIENEDYVLTDEESNETKVSKEIFVSKFEILFFVGDPSLPDPEILFLVDDEWVLANVTDLMGDQIKECHVVAVSPKNIGWKKIEDRILSLMEINDIKKIMEDKKVHIELEEITVSGGDITNMEFVIEVPKIREGKTLFVLN